MDAHSFQQALHQIDSMRRERRINEALTAVAELLVQEPHSSELLVRRAVLFQLSESERSLGEIEESLRVAQLYSPANLEASIELAHFLYAVRDRASEALPYFAAACDKAMAALKEALMGKIKCHAELKDQEVLASTLEQAARYFPEDMDFRLLRAELAEEYSA